MTAGTRMRGLWVYAGLVFQLARGAPSEQSPSRSPVDAVLAQLGDAFVSSTAIVNGTTLHYVRGGSGPAVILLHGFPQDWSVFRRIMPRLARTFTVVAVILAYWRIAGDGTSVPSPTILPDAYVEIVINLGGAVTLDGPPFPAASPRERSWGFSRWRSRCDIRRMSARSAFGGIPPRQLVPFRRSA